MYRADRDEKLRRNLAAKQKLAFRLSSVRAPIVQVCCLAAMPCLCARTRSLFELSTCRVQPVATRPVVSRLLRRVWLQRTRNHALVWRAGTRPSQDVQSRRESQTGFAA